MIILLTILALSLGKKLSKFHKNLEVGRGTMAYKLPLLTNTKGENIFMNMNFH